MLSCNWTCSKSSSQRHESVQGTARVIKPELGAKLSVTFASSPFIEASETEGNFWILETDYSNYAIVFLCLPDGQNASLRKFKSFVFLNVECINFFLIL